jgi:hypothetical protein
MAYGGAEAKQRSMFKLSVRSLRCKRDGGVRPVKLQDIGTGHIIVQPWHLAHRYRDDGQVRGFTADAYGQGTDMLLLLCELRLHALEM